MPVAQLSREEKGRLIAEQENQIQQIDECSYKVASQSREITYDVIRRENGSWICNCLDFHYRNLRCKHVIACQIREQLRERVREHVVIQPIEITACIFCQSTDLKKFGSRHNKYGDIQRFLCSDCRRTFSVNVGFERMKHNAQAITTAMQLYFSGESLMKYLYALMDDQTRFWIAQEVASTKYTADVAPLFRLGKMVTGKAPKTLITDGAPNFHEAYKQEFWTKKLETRTEHIQEIRLSGQVHNNKMERMNGEIRDRERVMRTLEKSDSPILSGMQIYHNYVKPHDGLKGKTPAEAAGVQIKGENKWLTLIQNAVQPKTERGQS